MSKLSSDPIPSVKLRPASKWAGSRQRGFAGEEEERKERDDEAEEGGGGGGDGGSGGSAH